MLMPFTQTQQQHLPQRQHGSQFLFFNRYKTEKYVLSTLQSFRLAGCSKEKKVFVLIYEKSQVLQIPPLGYL